MSHLIPLIVYACPTGPLNEQIEAYYAHTLHEFGPNKAHEYMPHCTLTGFFRDVPTAIPLYIDALEKAVYRPDVPSLPITITNMLLLPEWLGLTLEAEVLRERIAVFAQYADSPTRGDSLRLKDNLHVSLAYGFPSEQYPALSRLADEMVTPSAPVAWDLRFYERSSDNEWICHYSRAL
jgi:ubiquitin-associated SH3 domain-containing protein